MGAVKLGNLTRSSEDNLEVSLYLVYFYIPISMDAIFNDLAPAWRM